MNPIEKYQPVIGLEIHLQLLTKSKNYCADVNEYGSQPNTNISPVSLGHPGTLPRLNKKTLDYAVRIGLATNCTIRQNMYFARKNYFYADLPKGYQITQDTTPICNDGHIFIKDDEGNDKRIGITRIHIEEDAGKSIHDQDPYNTLVDLNRAGVPLLEIVSEPDLRSSTEAYNYVSEIRKLVRYLEICDGNMEEGSLRCDANISVMLKGSEKFGNRCEVKNMNSIRNVQRAIDHEVERQVAIIENGGEIDQETRNFDALSGTTSLLRSKENANDYRYFPEPDLQPVTLANSFIENVEAKLPPLPNDLFEKYTTEYDLSEYDARNLTEDKGIALYYEKLTSLTKSYKAAANWLMGDIKSHLNQMGLTIDEFSIEPKRIVELIELIEQDKVNISTASQKLFPLLLRTQESPIKVAEANNLIMDTSQDEVSQFIEETLVKFPDKVEAYKAGNKNLLGLFMGEIMKKTKGKADPKKINQILREALEK